MEEGKEKIFQIKIHAESKETKWMIFTQALKLFALQGIEGVSMRDIAEAVGIKVASIYNYFSSKEQLVEEMYHYYEEKTAPIDEYAKQIEYDGAIPVSTFLSQFVVNIPPEENMYITLILHIAMSRMRTDQRASQLIERRFQLSFEYLKRILYKMKEQEKIKDIDIEVYVRMYQHLCFSASYHLDTFMTIPFDEWIKMNDLFFSLIISEENK